MTLNRRAFIQSGIATGMTAALPGAVKAAGGQAGKGAPPADANYPVLDKVLSQPVLKREIFKEPIKIASLELFQFDSGGKPYYLVRARSADGAEGFAIPNGKPETLHPIFNKLVAPVFIGKDARDLEAIFEEVYVYQNNYKMQSLALWCPLAWAEFAILDMLGRMAKLPVGALLGTVTRTSIPMYFASGNRATTPEEEIAFITKGLEATGCHAFKFKVGGRMSHNEDSMPGRTEELIKLTRKTFGDAMTIQADANGSYDPPRAIEIGKMLEGIGAYMFEEPCPLDHLEDTKVVANALDIAVVGGEQESSEHRFRWMLANGAVKIVQPDLHYYGGFIRCTRVARMAEAMGAKITPHLSGGLGYSQLVHFASYIPNPGKFMEYKGDVRETGGWFDPPITFKDGALSVPTSPGFGLAAAGELMKKSKLVA